MKITSPYQAFRVFRKHLRSDVEELWALALNSDKDLLRIACLFRGTVNSCTFHPRDVFRFACLQNAASLIVAHNHPSGHAAPSIQDTDVTRQLLQGAKLMQIPIDDHLILAGDHYYSFLHAGPGPRGRSKKIVWRGDRSPD